MTDQRNEREAVLGRASSPCYLFVRQPTKAVQRNGSVQYQPLKKKPRKDFLTTSIHEPHDTSGRKKEKHKGKRKDKLGERHPEQRADCSVGHRRQMRFGSGPLRERRCLLMLLHF